MLSPTFFFNFLAQEKGEHDVATRLSPPLSFQEARMLTQGSSASLSLDLKAIANHSLRPHPPTPPFSRYHDEDDARRVYESGEQFSLDGRRLEVQYAQGRRKSKSIRNTTSWFTSSFDHVLTSVFRFSLAPNQMRGYVHTLYLHVFCLSSKECARKKVFFRTDG